MVDWPPVPLKQKHEAFSTPPAITMLCFHGVGEEEEERGDEERREEKRR